MTGRSYCVGTWSWAIGLHWSYWGPLCRARASWGASEKLWKKRGNAKISRDLQVHPGICSSSINTHQKSLNLLWVNTWWPSNFTGSTPPLSGSSPRACSVLWAWCLFTPLCIVSYKKWEDPHLPEMQPSGECFLRGYHCVEDWAGSSLGLAEVGLLSWLKRRIRDFITDASSWEDPSAVTQLWYLALMEQSPTWGREKQLCSKWKYLIQVK